ncbi:MAG: hypothetical protein AVO35_10275 [Candidatus Aegiribacteria sp. MLS_C]|nr:MAG: hypothetical protein AVO35_10275 [Candidatus Aegiribacteria sp. MLS_C]
MTVYDVAYPAAGFLMGSIPWSYIIGRLNGVDIRSSGSGNVGATNLFRVCGSRKAGLFGLLLDVLKGAVPVLAASEGILGLAPPAGEWTASATAICAVLGHVYSPWLGFRGGKGVATTMGALVILSPFTILAGIAVFTLVLLLTRYVSLGSISAAVAMVPSVFILEPESTPVRIIICVVAALILVRHKSNMVKLLHGRENRFSTGGGGSG